jgi:hypothetical protein
VAACVLAIKPNDKAANTAAAMGVLSIGGPLGLWFIKMLQGEPISGHKNTPIRRSGNGSEYIGPSWYSPTVRERGISFENTTSALKLYLLKMKLLCK